MTILVYIYCLHFI